MMKAYLLNITALVLFSAVIDTILPDKWNKYIKIITALMVTAIIISPFTHLEIPSFEEFEIKNEQLEEDGMKLHQDSVRNELEKRIEEDINQRIFDEYGLEIKSKVRVSTNDENEIMGVSSVRLSGRKIGDEILKRIDEIYSPAEVLVDEH